MKAVQTFGDIGSGRVRFIRILWAVTLVFVVGDYLRPPLAHALRHETLLWNYVSALEVSLAGGTALLAAVLSAYTARLGMNLRPRPAFLCVAGLGLLLVGADEMLSWHERLGRHLASDSIVKALSIGNAPDGVLVMFLGVLGALFAAVMLRDILADRTALCYYVVAAGCAVYSVLSDYLPRGYLAAFLPNCLEEITEVFFAVALASAFACHIARSLQAIIGGLAEPAQPEVECAEFSPERLDEAPLKPYM